jgi:hypothetical protein
MSKRRQNGVRVRLSGRLTHGLRFDGVLTSPVSYLGWIVFVISGDKVAMKPTLDEAILRFRDDAITRISAQARGGHPELGQARTQFNDAQKAMQQGNWETLANRWTRCSAYLPNQHQQGFDNENF